MRKGKLGIVIAFAACVLSGCGKRADSDEIAEDLNQYDIEATGGDAETGDTKDIPAHINETIVGANGYEYVIDADVVSDGYDDAAVYEVTMPEVNDALVKRYADTLFDNSEYTVVKPYEIMSIEELQAEKAFLETLLEREKNGEITTPSQVFNNVCDIECYMNYDQDGVPDYVPKGQLLYEQVCTVYEDGQDSTIVNDISRLRGKVDGEWWELSLYSGRDGACSITFLNLEFSKYAYSFVKMDEMSEVLYGTNASDRKECEKAADDFIAKLGYTDMGLAHTGNIVCEDRENLKNYMDGYRFAYSRNLEMQAGVSTQNMASLINPYESSEDYVYDIDSVMVNKQGAIQEYVWLAVSEGRVCAVRIDNIYDVGKKMSENTALLDFEQIMDVAREMIKKKIDNYEPNTGSVEYTMTDIELRYIVIPYEEGRYSMVPVWMLYQDLDIGYSDERYVEFGVNAIDGSIVYFLSYGGAGYFW